MTLVLCQSPRARDVRLPTLQSLAIPIHPQYPLPPLRRHTVSTTPIEPLTPPSSVLLLSADMTPPYSQHPRPSEPLSETELVSHAFDPGKSHLRVAKHHCLQVYVLSEIINKARERPQSPGTGISASGVLLDFITRNSIDPSWEDISLPSGKGN
jgi:hypothetical protein